MNDLMVAAVFTLPTAILFGVILLQQKHLQSLERDLLKFKKDFVEYAQTNNKAIGNLNQSVRSLR